MSAAALGGRPLRYFIHDDFDAFRIEISGNLAGRAAQKAYEAWRSARSMALRTRMVVDISFVTSADDVGQQVLRAWRDHDAQIVALSPASRAIVDLILPKPASRPPARRALIVQLLSLFCWRAAEIPARA